MRSGAWRLLAGVAVLGLAAAVLVAERRRPLRRAAEGKLPHDARNLAVAAASALTLRLLQKPLVEPLSALVERRRWGLVPLLRLPRPVETALAVALMDYTLYVWHVLTHRVPALWRFHLVHHADRDLTATTALRFHFGEMALSVPYRAAQVLLIGTSPRALSLWQGLVLASIVFHHANVRLPPRFERRLAAVVMTPRLHGIHHSVVAAERNSNWSSGLTLWDRLHGTLRLDVPQERIEIGVPAPHAARDLTLVRLMARPFQAPERTKPQGFPWGFDGGRDRD